MYCPICYMDGFRSLIRDTEDGREYEIMSCMYCGYDSVIWLEDDEKADDDEL